ncbi:hypothetical protein [Actinospica robiniae]|uniref:hypothetical protein n=1 Tax=Actinospica robiniae TaxID=304901 RepID=UPI0004184E70|nr:hypothetical protein [Actinospica robiniae]
MSEYRDDVVDLIADERRASLAEWTRVSRLALGLTFAALLPIGALRFGMSADSLLLGGVIGSVVAAAVMALGLCLGISLGCLLAVPLLRREVSGIRATVGLSRRLRLLNPVAAVAGMVLVDAAVMWALSDALPFRAGLLSCLYYCLPAVLLTSLAGPRSHGRLLVLGTVLVAGVSLALPVKALQTGVAAQQWLSGSGVSERAQAQVVVLPGLVQEPYTFEGDMLIAQFDTVQNGLRSWSAVETVRVGRTDPCGPILDADGDGDEADSLSCAQVAPDLWFRGGQLGQSTGYVLERDGLTITVSESWVDVDTGALRQAVLAAHPASDAELWTREGSARHSLMGLLLL